MESEIAKEMGLGLVEYQELLGKVRGTQLVYLEDMGGAEGDNDFLDRHVVAEGANPLADPTREDGCRCGPTQKREAEPGYCGGDDAHQLLPDARERKGNSHVRHTWMLDWYSDVEHLFGDCGTGPTRDSQS